MIVTKDTSKFKYLVWVTALLLACCSGYYSVYGLSRVFVGSSFAVILMASCLEFSKVVVASYLHNYWDTGYRWLRTYLLVGLVMLMLITSAGVYGFLSGAYQSTAIKLESGQNKKEHLIKAQSSYIEKIKYLDAQDVDIQKQILEISSYRGDQERSIATATRGSSYLRSSANRSEKRIDALYSRIDSNAKSRSIANDSVSNFNIKINAVDSEMSEANELGPLMFVSSVTGIPMNVVVNWAIILIVLVFDPLAMSLVIAANSIGSTSHKVNLVDAEQDKPLPEDSFDVIFEEELNESEADDEIVEDEPVEEHEPEQELEQPNVADEVIQKETVVDEFYDKKEPKESTKSGNQYSGFIKTSG